MANSQLAAGECGQWLDCPGSEFRLLEIFSFQKMSQCFVEFFDRFILLFDPSECHEKELLAMGGRVHQVLKKSRKVFHIRFQLPKPFPVVAALRWLRFLDFIGFIRLSRFFRHRRRV
jgi:hypothetical protein